MTSIMKKKAAKFKDYSILNPFYLDCSVLRKYNILNKLMMAFEEVGLGFMFKENPGVFEGMVWEFVYSFVLIFWVVQKSESE